MICPGFLLHFEPIFSRLLMIALVFYWMISRFQPFFNEFPGFLTRFQSFVIDCLWFVLILTRFWPFLTDCHWFLFDFEPLSAVFCNDFPWSLLDFDPFSTVFSEFPWFLLDFEPF